MIAHGTEDAAAALTGQNGTRPEALAAQARKIVLAGHTGRARAAELAQMLRRFPARESRSEKEETTEWT